MDTPGGEVLCGAALVHCGAIVVLCGAVLVLCDDVPMRVMLLRAIDVIVVLCDVEEWNIPLALVGFSGTSNISAGAAFALGSVGVSASSSPHSLST
jgi:hypothetical protein